jgi:monoamine oxidase
MMATAGNPDVIVIGAGAAGISAAIDIANAGLKVTILEARERIGGRIFTVSDPVHHLPVELGAEFIHGLPPEIWNLLNRNKVAVREVDGDNWCVEDGRFSTCDFFSAVDDVLEKLDDRQPDESFAEFLRRYSSTAKDSPQQRRAENWATRYVIGFNAADPALVGVHWLLQETRADEKIEGERSFRAQHGYADLINIFEQQLQDSRVSVSKGTVVHSVKWKRGRAEIRASSNRNFEVSAPRVLITVPLGVLQAREDDKGAIQFQPDLPPEKRNAIRNIMMGAVIRITLRFRERFWANLPNSQDGKSKTMENMSFLFSQDDWFPTWWTTMPVKSPFITGWAPFHCAERLSGKSESFVVEQALATLHRLLGVNLEELKVMLEHAYIHDWQSDTFARGAYSYGKAGAKDAQLVLSLSIEDTLFFAGEATDLSGHNGTVHGAIASGRRAAAEVAKSAGSPLQTGKIRAR